MNKIKIILIFGTRPETIKFLPVVSQIKKYSHLLECKIIVTAQHREMLDQMLDTNIIFCEQLLLSLSPNNL